MTSPDSELLGDSNYLRLVAERLEGLEEENVRAGAILHTMLHVTTAHACMDLTVNALVSMLRRNPNTPILVKYEGVCEKHGG